MRRRAARFDRSSTLFFESIVHLSFGTSDHTAFRPTFDTAVKSALCATLQPFADSSIVGSAGRNNAFQLAS